MAFYITIIVDRKRIRLKVERILQSDSFEQFRANARNQEITLQSNRPLFEKKGLRHRRTDWKILSGDNIRKQIVDLITEEIEASIKDGKSLAYNT
ncbi:MAG TPA: hypothetical protein VF487_18380 [Chitinophagaceae bacterium]